MTLHHAIAKDYSAGIIDMVYGHLHRSGVAMPKAETIETIARRLCWLGGNDPEASDGAEPLWKRYVERAAAAYDIAVAAAKADPAHNAGDGGTYLLTAADVTSLRNSLGMNQTQFGHLIGVGQVHVSDIERGAMKIDDKPIMRLLAVLDLPGVVTRLSSIPRMGKR